MKLSILALGAAVASILCVNHCSAQLSTGSAAPAHSSEGRLVAQSSDEKYDIFGIPQPAQSSTDEAYFAEGAEVSDPESLAPSQQSGSRSVLDKSVPVTTNGNQEAPLSVLAGTPEVGMAPVYWPQEMGGCPTPNPVASMMTRNWCTDGLWATYPCQNARQCAHIQQHIHGHNRYTTAYNAAGCNAQGCSAQGCNAQGYSVQPCDASVYNPAGVATAAPAGATTKAASATPAPAQPAWADRPQVLQHTSIKVDSVKEREQSPQTTAAPTAEFELSSIELPADVPVVPVGLQRSSAQPSQVPSISPQPRGTTLPSMPLPTSSPVIASRAFAPLR